MDRNNKYKEKLMLWLSLDRNFCLPGTPVLLHGIEQ